MNVAKQADRTMKTWIKQKKRRKYWLFEWSKIRHSEKWTVKWSKRIKQKTFELTNRTMGSEMKQMEQ